MFSCSANAIEDPNIVTNAETVEIIIEPEMIDKDYSLWQNNTRSFLTADLSSIVSDDSSNLAWGTSYVLNSFCRAYNATGDVIYLEKAAGYIYQIFQLAVDNDGDGYKSWGTAEYNANKTYEEFCVHVGAVLTSVGEFINLVYSTPSILTQKVVADMTYDEFCKYIVKEATENMIPAFDCDWNDEIGVYMNRPGSGNFSGATSPISLPNNQFLAMAATLIQFAKVSPDKEDLYLYRANAMLEAFKSKLKYDASGNLTTWNYKDVYFSRDYAASKEDYSHGMFDTRAAIMGYNNGLAFNNDDIAAFARAYEITMLAGTDSEPLLYQFVDGTGTDNNQLFLHIFDLAPFGTNNKIWEIGYKTAVYRNHFATRDAARILIYHENAPTPLSFSLLTPRNDAKYYGRMLFRWEVSVYSCKYTLQISDKEDFSFLIVSRDNILDTSVYVDGLPSGKTLYWRVIASNQSGKSVTSNTHIITTN